MMTKRLAWDRVPSQEVQDSKNSTSSKKIPRQNGYFSDGRSNLIRTHHRVPCALSPERLWGVDVSVISRSSASSVEILD